jgi:hypothetical protein
MAGTGEYTIADLGELFTVSRTTVYRTLQRHDSSARGPLTGGYRLLTRTYVIL